MIKVKTKIPSGSLTLLTKPNAAGECAVYLRYYLGSYIKKSTDIWGGIVEKAVWWETTWCNDTIGVALKECLYFGQRHQRSSFLQWQPL